MTSLSYTTGNPANLTGGAVSSMNDISGPFTDIKTFLTAGAGTIDYGNLAAVVDSYYKTIKTNAVFSSLLGPGTYVISETGSPQAQNSGTSQQCVMYLNSSDYPTGSRGAKLRVAVSSCTNTTAPGITYTFGLYPISAVGGGANLSTVTFGTVVSGSTAVMTTPTASSVNHAESTDFAFPTTGFYGLGVLMSGTETANAQVFHRVTLQFRAT